MIRRTRWFLALTATSALAFTVACSADSPSSPTTPTGSVSVGSRGPTASPSPSDNGEVTLAFAGDIHFAERTAKLLANPQTAIGPTSAVLSRADLAMANLETAITDGGVPEPKQYHFRAPATALTAMRAGGIDVVSMANNHALDYGQSGFADTLAAIEASKLPVVGVGHNAQQAYAPWITTVRGTRIAFLAFNQIHELLDEWTATASRPGLASALQLSQTVAAVKAARAKADIVVVYMHWGWEGDKCPRADNRALAQALATAGADVVVGTHAHLMLGDGFLGRTYVQYGLGNFVWWWDNAFSNDTGVLTLRMKGRDVISAQLTPARISSTGQPVVATGPTAQRILDEYRQLRACTGLAATPSG